MFSAHRHPLLHVLQATSLCALGVHKGSKKHALAWRQREKSKRPHNRASQEATRKERDFCEEERPC